MSELTELEQVMRSLKKETQEKKRFITELENEKKYLEERNRFLIEKLKQAGVLYEESGKRLIDFVEQNIKPLKTKIEEFEALAMRTREYEKNISASLKHMNEFEVIIGSFKKDMLQAEEKQVAISAKLDQVKKTHDEIARRISTVQTFGSEELGEKVEDIKAKFGEDTRKIEDEFSVLKLGVTNSIGNFKKEFERQSNALYNEMEKVDIKKAKELGDALAQATAELDKTKADFAKSMVYMEKKIESLDIKKSKEMSKSLEMLSAGLEERFASLSEDLQKKVVDAQSDLNRFRIELEKTLGKAKVDTRDFVASKSKEFDALLAELTKKMNVQTEATAFQWNKSLGILRSELLETKKEMEQLISLVDRKIEAGEERREKTLASSLVQFNAFLTKRLETETAQIYARMDDMGGSIDQVKEDVDKKTMDAEKELGKFKIDLEKTLGRAKVETRDFTAAKTKEFDALITQMKTKVDKQVQDSAAAWDANLGALRTELLTSKKEAEKLIGTIDRKVELGEERREKKLEAGFASMQALMTKKVEAEIDTLNAQIDDISRNVDNNKAELSKTVDLLGKAFDKSEIKRQKDIDKVIKEFMVVKGEVDEKISETSLELDKFSKMADTLRKQIVKESLAGVHEKTQAIFEEMEKKFELVEDGLVDKIASLESDFDEFNASFQATVTNLKTETDKKIEFLRKEFDKRDAVKDREAAAYSKTLQKDVEGRFASFEGKTDNRLKAAEDEITSLMKATDNFTVDLSEKFDSIIQAKTKEFGKEVKSLVLDMKAMEKGVGLVISTFKSDVEKSEVKKAKEIDRMLKEFIAAKGKIDEKLEDVDKRIAEFSLIKKELKKEIYTESLSGVQERVKDIVAGIDERFVASKDEMENKLSELMKGTDVRMREAEANLASFRVELEKTVGKLRLDVDKVTGKKTDETDRIVAGLRRDFEERVKVVNAEILENFEEMKAEVLALKGQYEKSATFIRKEFEAGELRRNEKSEKSKLALDKEFKLKLDDFAFKTDARTRTLETDMKALRSDVVAVVDKIRLEVDKITGKKTGELDKVVVALRADVETTVKTITDDISAGLNAARAEVAAVKKQFEAAEAKREDKTDRTRAAIERELKTRFGEYSAGLDGRVRVLETDNKTMSKGLAEITGQLKDKFDEIIAAKTDDFELSMEETVEKAEKARSDVEALAEGLKGKFQAGEAERRKETDKYLKELMILKGEMTKRMKDVDASINAFAGIRNSLKNEIIKENTVMVDSKLASLNENKKRDIVDSKASLKTEIDEMHVFVSKAVEKVGRLSEKIDGMKEDIYTVKKARTLVLDDVKSLGRTLDENNMVRMNNFLKEMEKRLRTQEQIIGARMADVEKKIGAVSEHASRTKKEKEAELDELLKHVES